MQHPFHDARTMPVHLDAYARQNVTVEVLRLDSLHPVISGNKWFKLQLYLAEAAQQQKKTILTFGGAYSNHIVATAAASAAAGFSSIGIIRGERPNTLSPTLLDAGAFGMQLFFTSREAYKQKAIPEEVYGHLKMLDVYVIPEGGYGVLGAAGSRAILKRVDLAKYTHIIAAIGTGTMLAGLIEAAPHQQVIGISVLKNNIGAEAAVKHLLSSSRPFQILHEFHFGGYAKHTPELLSFMNDWFVATNIPTDFVYTGKTFFAADRLIRSSHFPSGSSILLIHSGGLQGNRSLPPGTLRF